MTEILKMLGVENAVNVAAVLMCFLGMCALATSLVTEALKCIKALNSIPTKLVCYITAVCVTVSGACAMMAFLKQPVEWFFVFASFLAAFIVAKVSMGGWEDVTELWKRMIKKQG